MKRNSKVTSTLSSAIALALVIASASVLTKNPAAKLMKTYHPSLKPS